MTLNKSHFIVLVNVIKRSGYDEDTAVKYATLIGDTPVIDEEGKTVVTDSTGNELARFQIDYFDFSPYSRKGEFSIIKFLFPGHVDNLQRVVDEKQFQNLSPLFKGLLVIIFLFIIGFLIIGLVVK